MRSRVKIPFLRNDFKGLLCLITLSPVLHLISISAVIFLVFSPVKSVSAPLRGDVLLNCGFKQPDTPLAQELDIEWRLQHRGKGRKVLEMKTRLDDVEGTTVGKYCVKRCALAF